MTDRSHGISTRDTLRRQLERLRPGMIALASRLCSIATVNPPGSLYKECCRVLAAKLDSLGMSVRIVQPPCSASLLRRSSAGCEGWKPARRGEAESRHELTETLERPCLAGRRRRAPTTASGARQFYPRPSVIGRWDVGAARTLHFTGHYDVVPPTSGWTTDPFRPVVRGDYLIARGADDMKTSITAAIFAVEAMIRAGVRPAWNVEMSFTPDEETGGRLGLGYLVLGRHIRPDAAVLCEGGSGGVVGCAHKGVLWLEITVLGKSGHACNPGRGVNALEKACALIGRLKALEKGYARRTSAIPTSLPALRHPTLMMGGICGGGGKVNTIPDRFSFTVDRRVNPEEDIAEARAEILRQIDRAMTLDRSLKVSVRTLLEVPPGRADLDHPFTHLVRRAYQAVVGRFPRFRMTPGFTDMHWLTQDAGVPTIMYGVSGGRAHGDQEYSRISSMLRTARIYAQIAARGLPDR